VFLQFLAALIVQIPIPHDLLVSIDADPQVLLDFAHRLGIYFFEVIGKDFQRLKDLVF
jgi:hypothetical protein